MPQRRRDRWHRSSIAASAARTVFGVTPTRILSAQIWLADIADFAEMNAVWDGWVAQGQCPTRATGEAKLAAPGYRVEIIITAAQR